MSMTHQPFLGQVSFLNISCICVANAVFTDGDEVGRTVESENLKIEMTSGQRIAAAVVTILTVGLFWLAVLAYVTAARNFPTTTIGRLFGAKKGNNNGDVAGDDAKNPDEVHAAQDKPIRVLIASAAAGGSLPPSGRDDFTMNFTTENPDACVSHPCCHQGGDDIASYLDSHFDMDATNGRGSGVNSELETMTGPLCYNLCRKFHFKLADAVKKHALKEQIKAVSPYTSSILENRELWNFSVGSIILTELFRIGLGIAEVEHVTPKIRRNSSNFRKFAAKCSELCPYSEPSKIFLAIAEIADESVKYIIDDLENFTVFMTLTDKLEIKSKITAGDLVRKIFEQAKSETSPDGNRTMFDAYGEKFRIYAALANDYSMTFNDAF
ncbi:MAG: hypothetical protein LBB38_00070 [Puniceicoccales bacterium]|jgi:hypothetical protein|nr:hypothetical protein [Puniceicoccales bacterium]